MVGTGMFDGLFSGLLTIFVIGVLTFGTAGFFVGKHLGYKKAVNDIAYNRIQIVKTPVSDTSILIRR